MNLKQKIENLTQQEWWEFSHRYSLAFCKSVKLDPPEGRLTLCILIGSEGFGKTHPIHGRWHSRFSNWIVDRPLLFSTTYGESRVVEHSTWSTWPDTSPYNSIPIWARLAERILNTMEQQEKPEMKTFNKTKDTMLESNKEAFQIAAKLTAGKSANQLFLSNIMANFPWYVKLFGKKKDITDNPFAKLATAEIASALVHQFAGDNEKLKYVSDAMIQDAMLDISYNSELLEKMLEDLDQKIKLPESLLKQDK
jgi:hypothetical protein